MNTDPTDRFDSILASIDEEIKERALIAYVEDDRRATRSWGLLLSTEHSIHVVYGHGHNWIARMLGGGQPDHQIISVRRDSIDRIDLPPERGFWARMVRGRTALATIHRTNGPAITLDVDTDAIEILERFSA